MEVIIESNYDSMSKRAASIIANNIKCKPDHVPEWYWMKMQHQNLKEKTTTTGFEITSF